MIRIPSRRWRWLLRAVLMVCWSIAALPLAVALGVFAGIEMWIQEMHTQFDEEQA